MPSKKRPTETATAAGVESATADSASVTPEATETTRPPSLFASEQQLVALEALLDEFSETGNTITETELEAAAAAFLEATEAATQAVERYCWLIFKRQKRSAERVAQAKVWEDTAKEMRSIAETDSNLAKRLKQKLLEFFDRRGIKKLETDNFKLSARDNGGQQPLEIDESFSIQVIAAQYPQLLKLGLDHQAVRQHLENVGELPFAKLKSRGRSLVIKP